jgi:hypothetical protein
MINDELTELIEQYLDAGPKWEDVESIAETQEDKILLMVMFSHLNMLEMLLYIFINEYKKGLR